MNPPSHEDKPSFVWKNVCKFSQYSFQKHLKTTTSKQRSEEWADRLKDQVNNPLQVEIQLNFP